ncbi:DUF169 domain-containing protein [Raoultibacter phocaeensis]|uniref:DUF169 domain-containing protein n=1 Tax=Raoultibacter phocaeensis TaxID=2479841 RepID=UPI00111B6BEC|nr:DUF169 domain-containing protein [Raoultibacter phocaeensis]
MTIKPLEHDFSVFEKLGFEDPPVGVKFEYFKPNSIERLDRSLAMCEMVKEAQLRDSAFYMDEGNENCMGKGAMGMMPEDPSWACAGLIGERMGIFKDAGANMRCMQHYTTFDKGAVNYVAFAQLSALDFEPDLMVFSGPMETCEIVLRAMAYSTGEMYESKATPVFQCSWLYSYPQLTGKVNYIVMGTGHGTTARETYKSGTVLVSVPSPWFPVILENLASMELVPRAWSVGREAWLEEEGALYGKLAADAETSGE